MTFNRALNSIRVAIVVLLALATLPLQAQFEIPEKPHDSIQRTQRVFDYIDLLRETDYDFLNDKLLRYDDTTSTQIVIAIIQSTQGEDIALLGAQWGEKWGVGRDNQDNGIFITLAYGDRTVDISTGYGIEGILTDRMAEKVINQRMIPEFKNGFYYHGLNRGVDGIMEVLEGSFVDTPEPEYNYDTVETFPFEIIIIVVFFFIFFIVALGLKIGGAGGSTGSLHDTITYSNSGRSSSSWGSSSSSSWSSGSSSSSSSFGGGSFGGGGASGSW
ncbi:MAG: TPM domain-containing protein [Bacteroidota bacterium]